MDSNLFIYFKKIIITELKQVFTELDSEILQKISSEPPKEEKHGHVSTNAAMLLAKILKKSPREIASIIAQKLEVQSEIEKVEIAGPGFVNLFLSNEFWQKQTSMILSNPLDFTRIDIGKNEEINLEFVSANPTGPLHVGHSRGAIYGDCLANLLENAGYKITREYYINDAGSQVETLLESVKRRMNGQEITEGLYPGEYLVEIANKIKNSSDTEMKKEIIDEIMVMIKQNLANLSVSHDVFTSEKKLHDSGLSAEMIEKLIEKNLTYVGSLESPKDKSHQSDNEEKKDQLIFKSSDFGDDMDRVIKKHDDSLTYFAGDLAYMQDKISRGFSKQIMILGADHGGYKKRLQAAIKALSDGKAEIEVQFVQIVNFLKDGEVMKMSKRSGNYVTTEDVIEMVGKDALRFIMLTRKNDAVLDFDIEKVKEQSKDNPSFYVQYAFARANSILIKAQAQKITPSEKADFSLLFHEKELELMRIILSYPRKLEQAAIAMEPHRIAFFLMEMAASFHGFWHYGKQDDSLRFITKNENLSEARISLVAAFVTILESGFNILKIEPKKEM